MNFLKKHAPFSLLISILIATLCIYMRTIGFGLMGDDVFYVGDNSKLANLPWNKLWRLFVEPYNVSHEFLPLRDFTYWFDMAISKDGPYVFRVDNILLYALGIPLVYAVTYQLHSYCLNLSSESGKWFSAVVAIIYAVHPALVESVVWISGRKYILPNLFALLALWLALKVRRNGYWSNAYAGLTLLAFICVMFSKSSFIGVAPLISLLWLSFYFDTPKEKRNTKNLLCLVGIVLLGIILLSVFIFHNAGFDGIPMYFGFGAITRSLAILGGLFRISISPENRHFYYPVYNVQYYPVMVFLGATILASSIFGAWKFLRQKSIIGFSIAAFLLLCLPYLQIIPAKPPSYVADRYISLAIFPMMLLITSILWRIKASIRVLLICVLVLVFGCQMFTRSSEWEDQNIKFIKSDYMAYPEYYMPTILYLQNSLVENKNFDVAIKAAKLVKPIEAQTVAVKLFEFERDVYNGNFSEAMIRLPEIESELIEPPESSNLDGSLIILWSHFHQMLARNCELIALANPKDFEIRYQATICRMRMYPQENYASDQLKIIAYSPGVPEVIKANSLKAFGLSSIFNGHPEGAVEALLEYEKLRPNDKQTPCMLADVYRSMGDIVNGSEALNRCKKLNAKVD